MRHPAIDLINSFHMRGHPDRVDDDIANADWQRRFAKRWTDAPLGDTEIGKLRVLRTALRGAVEELTKVSTLSDDTLTRINAFVQPRSERPLLKRAADGKLELSVQATHVVAPVEVIARAFQSLIVGDGALRVKVCANPHCRWAFFDESRNRSRRWCDSSECGNVMKARAFRAREASRDKDTPL